MDMLSLSVTSGERDVLGLRKVLSEHGWEECSLERCVFRLRDQKGEIVAILFAHVDDLLLAVDDLLPGLVPPVAKAGLSCISKNLRRSSI